MELFRALAQVTTGTGPLLRARPRSRFEATDQGGRIDVVEPEIDARPSGRAATPPPPADPAATPMPTGSGPVDRPSSGVGHRPTPSVERPPVPATVVAGPVPPDAPVTRVDPPAAARAAAGERVVHERETRHTVERVVERRTDGPSATGPPQRQPVDRPAPERPRSVDGDAPVPDAVTAAPRPQPPSGRRPVDGPPPRPATAPAVAAPALSRRDRSAGARPEAAAPSEPAVVVHIGRLEVRTVVPAKPAPKPVPLHFAGPDLGDFLGATP